VALTLLAAGVLWLAIVRFPKTVNQ
jgi:hypothetical protein